MPSQDDLFQWATLATLQGSAVACYIVPNVLGKVFTALKDSQRAGIALVLGLALQIGFAMSTVDKMTFETWVVAILNGFLAAATALGINQATTAATGGNEIVAPASDTFRASWL